jgi:glucose/arabinose dehydrogenase/PKD repeat protein
MPAPFRPLVACALALAAAPAAAQQPPTVPGGFEVVNVGGVYVWPVGMAFTPQGDVLIAEKSGYVRVRGPFQDQGPPFLDLSAEGNNHGDRGMLGITVHPGFVADGGPTSWVYMLYTVSPLPGQDVDFDHEDRYSFSRLTRYRAVTVDGVVAADPATREVLLGNQLPDGTVPDGIASLHSSHSNGTLTFSPDGTLLVGLGDGAHFDLADHGGNDPAGFESFVHPVTGRRGPMAIEQDSGAFRAQDLRSLAGKILRLDPETGLGLPSNPFWDGDPQSNASRVWALGARNPFRFTLQPGTSSTDPDDGAPGTLFIGDVGNTSWEELSVVHGGENMGWPCYESQTTLVQFWGADHGANPLGYPVCEQINPGVLTTPLLSLHHSNPWQSQPQGLFHAMDGTPLADGPASLCIIGGAFHESSTYPAEYDGRLFFADFIMGWIWTLALDAQGAVVEAREFTPYLPAITDMERHPITGDVYVLSLFTPWGQLLRIRHGSNQTPVASIASDVTAGALPLTVSFDGSGSADPDQDPLVFEWNFGDGSPRAFGVAPQHEFATAGSHDVTLTVTDPDGLSAVAQLTITAGNTAPSVLITSPAYGSTHDEPEVVAFTAEAVDQEDEDLVWSWSVDELHRSYVVPQVAGGPGDGAFSVELGAPGRDAFAYHRVTVTVEDSGGLKASDEVYVYPRSLVRDGTGDGTLLTRVAELDPPLPQGSGNPDVEVVRDAIQPPEGSTDELAQWDSSHGGDQAGDDWIGVRFPTGVARQVSGLSFQEGIHRADGGWFADLQVEVYVQKAWVPVRALHVTPDYPFASAAVPGFDGVGFETYELRFEPTLAEGVRLRGTPGGASAYISAAELRVLHLDDVSDVPQGFVEHTGDGTIIGRVFELSPPGPTGAGSADPETIRNGTAPPPGTASLWSQFDTEHGGDQQGEDWIGYSFPAARQFSAVSFQEGMHRPEGGWFEDVEVQVRANESAPWVAVPGAVAFPPYPGRGPTDSHYDAYAFVFPPVWGRNVRIIGTPGGSLEFVSVGELRVFGPAFPDGCAWDVIGPGQNPGDVLTLESWTPPRIGHLLSLEILGAPDAGWAWIGIAANDIWFPVYGGTLLLDPATSVLLETPLPLSGAGEGRFDMVLPSWPSIVGARLAFQAYGVSVSAPGDLLFSNALRAHFCE